MFTNKIQFWKKVDILKPSFSAKWMNSHYAVPLAHHIKNDIYKIIFCIRDKNNYSNIVSFNYDIIKRKIVNKIQKKPLLIPGKLGTFDENGVTPSWLIKKGNKYYLYYVGWNKSANVRMQLFTGLAISNNNLNKFKRFSKAPILERIKIDPFLTATNCVIKVNGLYKMWYVSGDKWNLIDKETYPKYNIKYATSKDGINWERVGKISVNYKHNEEYALARPSVLKFKDKYHMWYSYKNLKNEYKIGYACSKNGINFKREDQKIFFSKNIKNFDDKMIAYPHVFLHKKNFYMLFNGNDYGKSGIGLAMLDDKKI